MTPIELFPIFLFFTLTGTAIGWTLRGYEVDDLNEQIDRVNTARADDLAAWQALHAKYLRTEDAIRDGLSHLKTMQTLQHRCFHYENEIKKLRAQLAKFHQVRGKSGRFEKKPENMTVPEFRQAYTERLKQ